MASYAPFTRKSIHEVYMKHTIQYTRPRRVL